MAFGIFPNAVFPKKSFYSAPIHLEYTSLWQSGGQKQRKSAKIKTFAYMLHFSYNKTFLFQE